MADDGTPRRSTETDPYRQLALKLADLERTVAELGKSATLRNASISGGDGLTVKDAAGVVRLRISTAEAAIIAYDSTGAEVARYGLLSHSDAGQYGIEALTPGGWSHVGSGTASWATLDGKPSTFPPTLPIAGTGISGAVANATEASHAALADGSKWGFDNVVSGSTFYALWVGNDGGYHLGRNTSSKRYKFNVRDLGAVAVDSADTLMAIRPVIYDRKDTEAIVTTPEGERAEGPGQRVRGARDEFGLIAEEVAVHWPEVITYYDHEDGQGPTIDGIRYDLIGPRLIPYIQDTIRDNRDLREQLARQAKLIADLTTRLDALGATS